MDGRFTPDAAAAAAATGPSWLSMVSLDESQTSSPIPIKESLSPHSSPIISASAVSNHPLDKAGAAAAVSVSHCLGSNLGSCRKRLQSAATAAARLSGTRRLLVKLGEHLPPKWPKLPNVTIIAPITTRASRLWCSSADSALGEVSGVLSLLRLPPAAIVDTALYADVCSEDSIQLGQHFLDDQGVNDLG
ncbi:hypothetical protein CEUSTIGMA_g5968.t1 [Chlamydomonas eustigma]|uniref:Uncharacterized protein n=1 Tax=Chlamydomonas eustigma TaxID=1157962 RepID=A0A250X640_9CHLO|nr:hypothetical protein CEUSTIGMA_g5968.t1 [Chlamydomonas eustigma]|eukprot:GAX78528.1 hypothetical protein CEUSTIGMA_g5968.t1 [Chlamydomonas eustigma]